MESKKINQLATELAPELSDLTIIGDPTTGISKKITLSQMANLFTGTVEEYASLSAFPLVGTADTIYIALDTNVIYRWNSGTSSYNELSPNIVTSLVFSDANGFDGTISLVGSTATLSITTALTAGSVPFIGASGALSQDNANHYWDNTNKRLGINTNAPTTALDAFGSGIIGRFNGTSTNNAFLGFASAGSNKWSIGNVQSDHRFRIYSEANTTELVSVLQTGEFGIGIANPLTKLHIFGGATALIANLDANVSVAKSISFRSDNSNRFNIEVSGTESGSNAGANFFIRRYSDAGALIDTPFTITRSTGALTIPNTISFGAGAPTAISGTDGTLIIPKIRLYNGTPASVYHDIVSGASTNNSITIPDITGTMALLEGTQTFSGVKTFSSLISTTAGNGISAGGNSFAVSPSSTRGVININGSTDQFLTLASNGYLSGSSTLVRLQSTPDLDFVVGGSQRLLIAASGGKATFSNALSIKAGYAGDKFLFTGAGSGDALGVLYDNTGAAKIQLYTNGISYLTGGDVGIGTTTPSRKLHVSGTGVPFKVTSSNNSFLLELEYSGGSSTGYIGTLSNGLIFAPASGSTALTIGSNANVGIGSGSLANGTAFGGSNQVNKLKVASSTYTCLEINGSTSGASIQFTYGTDLPNQVASMIAYNYGAGTVKELYIGQQLSGGSVNVYSYSGGVTLASGATSWTSSSDERLKNINSNIDNAIEKLMTLRAVNFSWKSDETNKENLGLIAQEVEAVFPQVIEKNKLTSKPGEENIDETEYLGVKYTELIPVLVKAIQELKAEIETLKTK